MSTAFEQDENSIVEFQLGNKQLFLLFLGLLVICAIFFFIGLRVGEDTAQARIPVDLRDSAGETAAEGGQTLDLQPLGTRQQKPVSEEKSGAVAASTSAETKQAEEPATRQTSRAKPAEETASKKPEPKRESNNTSRQASVAKTGIFVQLIATKNAKEARQIRKSISGTYSAQIQKATVNGTLYNRVLVGPFESKDAAGKYKDQIKGKYKGAFINIVR